MSLIYLNSSSCALKRPFQLTCGGNIGAVVEFLGSGAGRIRNFLPEPDSGLEKIISDQDTGSPDPDEKETKLL